MADASRLGMGQLPTLDTFRAVSGTTFTVQLDDDRRVEAALARVDQSHRRPGWETGSLLFESDALIPQGSFPIRHSTLGTFVLFLVPVVSERPGYACEAVLNRPTS